MAWNMNSATAGPFANTVGTFGSITVNGVAAGGGNGGAGTVTNITNTTSNTFWTDTIIATGIRTLTVSEEANFDGEVKIKGKSLTHTLEKIEERLGILHPNPELETRWDELRELGERYKTLEKELLEKEKVWAILKR